MRRRQWADTRVPRYGTVPGTNLPLFPTHRPESDEDWDRRYYGGTNAGQERWGGGTDRRRVWKPPGMSDAEWERTESYPRWAEEWEEESSEEWSEEDVDDRWIRASGAAISSSWSRRRALGSWGRGGAMARRFPGGSWYEDAQFLVGLHLSPPLRGVKRGSGGGQWRRRQWADTRVPRYGTVRGTNRPLFPTHRPESDADWDRLYYGGTNAAQERGLRAEDSWYVAREQPRRMERPDYRGGSAGGVGAH